jgi:cystathionine beta-synthase
MGTGGTITGTGRFLKEKDPSIQVVGVDPKGSILKEAFEHEGQFKTKPKTYLIDGIGEDFVPGATDFSVIDEILQCTDEDAYSTTMALARKEGLLVGSSSGAAVWGALEYAKRLQPKETLVVLLPDSGERYLSKLNPTWLKEKGLTMAAAGGR